MKQTILIFTLLFSGTLLSAQQKITGQLKKLEGIWIAQEYLNSFEKTKSCLKSIDAFNPILPAGLRINCTELSGNILNIGYAELHNHMLFPEVSNVALLNGDTVHEQGSFQIDISKPVGNNTYEMTPTDYFNDESKGYFSWKFTPDTVLILHKPVTNDEKEINIRFKRISHTFKNDYPYPNPLYFYLRSKLLVGTYILKDSTDKILSNELNIDIDGKIYGYENFKNKIAYISTDIYCGVKPSFDYAILCDVFKGKADPDCDSFIYNRIDEHTIQLHKISWSKTSDGEDIEVLGKMVYRLERK